MTATIPETAVLVDVLPPGGYDQRELLRLAASLVWHLDDAHAQALVCAVEAAGIAPAPLEGTHLWASQEGLPSMIDGRMLALGRLEFLQRLGLEPRAGEIDMARRQEERGRVLFFLVAICIGQCVGLFGVRHSAAWRSPSYPYRASGPPPS